jgi:hypothetical protein
LEDSESLIKDGENIMNKIDNLIQFDVDSDTFIPIEPEEVNVIETDDEKNL